MFSQPLSSAAGMLRDQLAWMEVHLQLVAMKVMGDSSGGQSAISNTPEVIT